VARSNCLTCLAKRSVVVIAFPDPYRRQLAGMPVEDRAVDDPDLREHFGVADQEYKRLAVRELVDGEGLAEADPVGCVSGHHQHHQPGPAEYSPELLHGGSARAFAWAGPDGITAVADARYRTAL
jgi:hypothetical protein